MISKETAQKILNHQVEGIMFHSDMVDLFTAMGDKRLKRRHEKQVLEETCALLKTKACLYGELGTVLVPVVTAQPRGAAVKSVDDTTAIEWSGKALATWLTWEHDTKALYEEAAKEDSACKLWHVLLADVNKEISCIKRLSAR